MPIRQELASAQAGELEDSRIMFISELEDYMTEVGIEDAIVIVIPDTGKAKFNPSHMIESGKSKGKMSKATFKVAQNAGYYGDVTGLRQAEGDHKLLPLTFKYEVWASAPNAEGKTVDEALNRVVKLEAVKTGTDG